MAILDFKTTSVGQAGVNPRIIYIDTNDTLATVTTTGYLNNLVRQGIVLSELDVALVSTKTSPTASSSELSWLDVTKSGNNWNLVALTTPSTVATVTGTADRITVTGSTNVVVNIASTYAGQNSITTLGTITTGIWNSNINTASCGTSKYYSPRYCLSLIHI